MKAKQDLAAIFDALPQQAQDDILVHKSVLKQTLKDKSKPNTSTPTVTQATPNHEEDVKDTPSGSKKNGKRKADDVENTGDEVCYIAKPFAKAAQCACLAGRVYTYKGGAPKRSREICSGRSPSSPASALLMLV